MLSLWLVAAIVPVQSAPMPSWDKWSVRSSLGVRGAAQVVPSPFGPAIRVEYDFAGKSGFVLANAPIGLNLPENYEFVYRLRGSGPANNLEVKLLHPDGESVWWHNRVGFEWPTDWAVVRSKKRSIGFAWGPGGGGDLKRAEQMEFGIAASEGGKGWVEIADLRFQTLGKAEAPPKTARASKTPNGVRLDLGKTAEFSGLRLDWPTGVPRRFDVRIGDAVVSEVKSEGKRAWVRIPETTASSVFLEGENLGLPKATVLTLDQATTENQFLTTIAKSEKRGAWPRHFLGEQSFWTVVGGDADPDESLFNEDGLLEFGKRKSSIDASLAADGKTYTWADGKTTHGLEDGWMPLPWLRRSFPGLELSILPWRSVGATGPAADYIVKNTSTKTNRVQLVLKEFPTQVNPPWQNLNTVGGYAPVGEDWTKHLSGAVPTVEQWASSGARVAKFDLEIAAGKSRTIMLRFPGNRSREEDRKTWHAREDEGPRWIVPPSARPTIDRMLSQIAYVLVNRDGPKIQPGPRVYERSWIRDGSLTSAALLRTGHPDVAKAFLDWYAGYVTAEGWVPCVVDRRGADMTAEHDSHGQFVFCLADILRFTGDRAFAAKHYSTVKSIVGQIRALRALRSTPEYRDGPPEKRMLFGMVPESISHEGYSAKAMHSYWDALFVWRGLRDAAWLAEQLGHPQDAADFARERDSFGKALTASVLLSAKVHKIDTIPGCAELGDFDPTATAIGLYPLGAQALFPASMWKATFDKYIEFHRSRARRGQKWDAYTPYEIRICSALLALGRPEEAFELLSFFGRGVVPNAWNAWGEIVYRNAREGRFVGDLPHTWVGSEYVRYVRNMFGFERDSDQSLVLAAGFPKSWYQAGKPLGVDGLRTAYGTLGYAIVTGAKGARVTLSGGVRVPPGGLLFAAPKNAPYAAAKVDGQEVHIQNGFVKLDRLPKEIVFGR